VIQEVPSPEKPLQMSCVGRELLPGFVLLPRVLPLPFQQKLLDLACGVAQPVRPAESGGWYRFDPSTGSQLNDGSKARFWDRIELFPEEFRGLGEELARRAVATSPELAAPSKDFEARVVALNFYTGRGKMNWHKDDYNFAKQFRPIVMASIGASADFGYKMKASDPDDSVRLESGDVIVFGGPARDLVHALLRVFPETCPEELSFPAPPGPGRVSITWRDVGPEDGLTFNSDERLGLKITANTLPRYLPSRAKGGSKGKKGYGYARWS